MLDPSKIKMKEQDFSSCISEDASQINEADHDGSGLAQAGGRIFYRKPEIFMGDSKHEMYLREMGITGLALEETGLNDEEDLARLKLNMRIYFPSLMATMVEILLFK